MQISYSDGTVMSLRYRKVAIVDCHNDIGTTKAISASLISSAHLLKVDVLTSTLPKLLLQLQPKLAFTNG